MYTHLVTHYLCYNHMFLAMATPTLITFNIDALDLDPNWILANASNHSTIVTLVHHSIYYQ